jgi:hypothetical protein
MYMTGGQVKNPKPLKQRKAMDISKTPTQDKTNLLENHIKTYPCATGVKTRKTAYRV